MSEEITLDVVRTYKAFTPKFLCGLDANIYNIKFKRFKVRDIESDFVLFDISDDSDDNKNEENKENNEAQEENLKKIEEEDIYKSPRMIRYNLKILFSFCKYFQAFDTFFIKVLHTTFIA